MISQGQSAGRVAIDGATFYAPSSLFAGGETGAWYDPSDLNSMFQDSAGTTPAAVDSPVGRILDRSGNNNHATQATAGSRPTLRAGGYLEFDGTSDWLRALFTVTQPWDRVSTLHIVTGTGNGARVLGGGNTGGGVLYYSTSVLYLLSTSLGPGTGISLDTNIVVTERENGASSTIADNNDAYAVAGTAGVTEPGGITIGASNAGASFANIRFYGTVMIDRAMTDPEIAALRTYMGAKAGLSL